jgi:hypothetical protein
MQELTLELEYRGIIPLDGECEEEFIKRAERILENAQKACGKLKGGANYVRLLDVRDELDTIEEKYKLRPDWIPVAEVPDVFALSGPRVEKINDIHVPFVRAQDPKALKIHELIHSLRGSLTKDYRGFRLDPRKDSERLADEALVNYLSGSGNSNIWRTVMQDGITTLFLLPVCYFFLPYGAVPATYLVGLNVSNAWGIAKSKQTVAAAKHISDLGYDFVLPRLKPPEIRELCTELKKGNEIEDFFSDDELRHRIILERLKFL